jgi:hypothetical protein
VGTPPGQSAGGYRFFFVSVAPGHKSDAAAVAEDGTIMAPSTESGWHDYLGQTEPRWIHEQVGWLNGMWGTLTPTSPGSVGVFRQHPGVEPLVNEPVVLGDDSERTFRAWYFEPPAMMAFELMIQTTPTTATFTRRAAPRSDRS